MSAKRGSDYVRPSSPIKGDDSEESLGEEEDREDPQLGFGEDLGDAASGNESSDEEEEPKIDTTGTAKKSLLQKMGAAQLYKAYDPFNNPPKLVLVQGPPKSGKTTLIRSLVKHYTGQSIRDPTGPITVKTSNRQRITLLESPNDVSQMTDLAKVPDLLLCLVDASLGFEMQTFEFCAVLQIHGFPRTLAVATHMDFYRENKKKRRVKALLKKRIAVEVSKETKIFFTNGFLNGQYLYRDAHNIARYLSVMNPHDPEFKKQHPHVVVDRFDLLNSNLAELADNTLVDIAMFGYCRGNDFRKHQNAFLTGLGFLRPSLIEEANDPVKLQATVAKTKQSSGEMAENSVNEAEDDEEGTERPKKTGKTAIRAKPVRKSLKKFEKVLYAPQSNVGLATFDDMGDFVTIPDKYVVFTKIEGQAADLEQHEGVKIMRELQNPALTIREQLHDAETFLFDEVVLDQTPEIRSDPLAKTHAETKLVSDLAHRVAETRVGADAGAHDSRVLSSINFRRLIYDPPAYMTPKRRGFDSTRFTQTRLETVEFYKEKVKPKFATGFTGNDESEADSPAGDYQLVFQNEGDAEADSEAGDQAVAKGRYMKVVIRGLRFSIYKNFAAKPLILSQFSHGEDSRGFVLVKFKRHRFYRSILKSGDPLIIAAGFHKFQTLPYFCKKDPDDRLRFLKYTPKYDFCLAAFYGNSVPSGMGVVAYQGLEEGLKKFRVAATGVVVGFGSEYPIKKKLKLVGEPSKVFKNTAFIKGMFSSDLEVAKFVGAKIKTVSGIRGQIKKAVHEGEEGTFRASFEDKVILTDLVFLRTWISVPMEKFYNPIVSFDAQSLLRTTWQLRRKLGLANPDADKKYQEVQRPEKRFSSLRISKNLAAELPFKTKEKRTVVEREKAALKAENQLVAAVSTDQEKSARFFVQRLKLIEKERRRDDQRKGAEKRRWREKWEAGMKQKLLLKKKAQAKEKYREMGKRKAKGRDQRDD